MVEGRRPARVHRLRTSSEEEPPGILAQTEEPPPSGAIRISGALAMTFAERLPIPVGDVKGHVLVTTQAKGTNRNTGPSDCLAGEVTSTEIAYLS
jgi:hypothetical protein